VCHRARITRSLRAAKHQLGAPGRKRGGPLAAELAPFVGVPAGDIAAERRG